MEKMKHNYGSEFQLLRFLGYHRSELEESILKNTNINPKSSYKMVWLERKLNGEYEGIDFLPKSIQTKISKDWKAYWPQRGNAQNWDAVIHCLPASQNANLKEKWIIVEAKAHLQELKSNSGAKDIKSIEKINEAFNLTKQQFGIDVKINWLKDYYQLANRLAFINFMRNNGIECSLLNIYFINGWPVESNKNVATKNDWKKAIDDEYQYLGVNSQAKKYISEIFIDCKGQ